MRHVVAAAAALGLLIGCGGSSGSKDPSVGTSEEPILVLHCPLSYCDGHPPPPPCYQLECNYLWTVGHPGPVPTCVQVPVSAGARCSDALDCVAAGTCDGNGTCSANPRQREVCTTTQQGTLDQFTCLACTNWACAAIEGNQFVYPAPSWACQTSWQ